ncbi:MAG: prepilin peptidase [Alphaproteobacteria bacterium]|nr:prepilin peptidase [Alphaproteobacteria bacterium]
MSLPPYPIDSPIWWGFVILLLIAIATDVRRYEIPNWLVLVLLAGGLALLAIELPNAVIAHVLTGLGGLVVGFILYAVTGMGAGDAKLLAASLLWAGPGALTPMLFWLAIASALLVILLLAGRYLAPKVAGERKIPEPLQKDAAVPFALAISPAVILASSTFPPAFW